MLHASALQNIFLCIFCWRYVFFLCCCCFFLLYNSKISGAFFCLFNFCTLHSVLICVVHSFLCVCLHFFLHFGFVCVMPCLPYFLQWFCALVYLFLLPKCSLLHFSFCAGFSPCHFLVFRGFFSAVPSVSLFRRLLPVIILCSVLFLRLFMVF